jgi:hypothetical protein
MLEVCLLLQQLKAAKLPVRELALGCWSFRLKRLF